ncbi:MAG: Hpt domain-containing protein [Moraxellaceae bacterium]
MTDRYLDEALLEELRSILESEFPALVTTYINDTTQRVHDLQQSFAAGDADAVRKTAHSIKGASANLGLHHLADLCQQLEEHARSGQLAGQESCVQAIGSEQQRAVGLLRARL